MEYNYYIHPVGSTGIWWTVFGIFQYDIVMLTCNTILVAFYRLSCM